MWKELGPYIVPLLAILWIIRRSGRARTVRLGRMWVLPSVLGVITVGALLSAPMPGPMAIGGFVVAALTGAGLGYLSAHHLHLSIDPKTGQVSSRATMVGTLLIAALFVARFGVKLAFPQLGMTGHGHAGAEIVEWSNGLLIFTVATFFARTLWIWNRTRPLLAEHAARTTAAVQPPQ